MAAENPRHFSPNFSEPEKQKGGIKINNAHHLILMALPNILNPHKLGLNIRYPIGELIHTNHRQYPLENSLFAVEHFLFGKIVTVDVVMHDTLKNGMIARAKQLFNRNFYYGHGEYFPQAFELVDRMYVKGDGFDLSGHLKQFIN